ncbi:AAA family ATPase [Thiorhodococcus fuscus]|uniref:AAA family ATPase n=1 Tax=Thiorhodococcus fuscus TaxID=527200 RepID=A0ABW4Y7D6_9GAMM
MRPLFLAQNGNLKGLGFRKMRINKLSYESRTTGWCLKSISFDQLTLLVGASGVGKTRILRAILDLKKISRGESLNGVRWSIIFHTRTRSECRWEGAFEDKGLAAERIFDLGEDEEKDKPKIEFEKVFVDECELVSRTSAGIVFDGKETVKLSQTESVLSLLKEEEKIGGITAEFERVIFDDNTGSAMALRRFAFDEELDEKLEAYKTIEAIRNCREGIKLKLYFAYMNQRECFDEIAGSFIDVFPYVEKVKVEPLTDNGKKVPLFFRETPIIQIKEKGISNWIDESKMSSGMHRVLMHVAELYLCADSSLILIDEFENSLGVNCIDDLTDSILEAGRDLQFIMTSHHPYIINNIDFPNWKIITRKAGIVFARDAADFNLGTSKHQAFTQLINLEEYLEGVQ